jgi:hypothetical protein
MEDGQRIINQYQDRTTDYQSVLRKDNRLSISNEEGQPITWINFSLLINNRLSFPIADQSFLDVD